MKINTLKRGLRTTRQEIMLKQRKTAATAIALLALLLLQSACNRPAAQLRVDTIPSQVLGKPMPVTVVLPKSYLNGAKKAYPVIYLLHGWSGDYRQWSQIADLPALADQYQVIFVCPEGGYDSWYLDSPVADSMQYESHIMREVLPYIDSHYRTRGAKARAITGLSMGGHGALRFVSLYPDSFVAAGSMSGILDLRPFADKWNLIHRLGAYNTVPRRWDENSDVNLVQLLRDKNKGIVVNCGTEDFAIGVNRAYRDSAAVHGVKIRYEETPGAHNQTYWAARIEPQVRFLAGYFKAEDR